MIITNTKKKLNSHIKCREVKKKTNWVSKEKKKCNKYRTYYGYFRIYFYDSFELYNLLVTKDYIKYEQVLKHTL